MNCFEARRDFAGLWRRTLDGERSQGLLTHLSGCAKCDRAFRIFALSAPMLNANGGRPAASVSRTGGGHASARSAAVMRRATLYRLPPRQSRLMRLGAGMSAVAVAAMVAYLAAARPRQSMDDAFGSYYSTVDMYGQEMPAFSNDLAG